MIVLPLIGYSIKRCNLYAPALSTAEISKRGFCFDVENRLLAFTALIKEQAAPADKKEGNESSESFNRQGKPLS